MTVPIFSIHSDGVPASNAGISPDPGEEHNAGEVWCNALWNCRAKLIDQDGFSANELMLRLVTDGQKFGPPDPNFIEARTAVIVADIVDNRGCNRALLWEGFAERGLGFAADTYGGTSSSVGTVNEDRSTPIPRGCLNGISSQDWRLYE